MTLQDVAGQVSDADALVPAANPRGVGGILLDMHPTWRDMLGATVLTLILVVLVAFFVVAAIPG